MRLIESARKPAPSITETAPTVNFQIVPSDIVQLEQAEAEAWKKLKIARGIDNSYIDRNVHSGLFNRPIARLLTRFGKRGFAQKIAPEIVAEIDYKVAQSNFNNILIAKKQIPTGGIALPDKQPSVEPISQNPISVSELLEAADLPAIVPTPDITVERQVEIRELAAKIAVEIVELDEKKDDERDKQSQKPRWGVFRPPTPRNYEVKISSTQDPYAPAENVDQPNVKPLADAVINVRKMDNLGIFDHKDFAARQRMGVFFRDFGNVLEDIKSQMDGYLVDSDPTELKQGVRDFSGFNALHSEFRQLMDVDTTQKQKLLETPLTQQYAVGGTSTVYSPGLEFHGRRYVVRNYHFGLPAFVNFDIPGSSKRDVFKVSIFPIPYSRYKQGERTLRVLDDLKPQEAREILHEKATTSIHLNRFEIEDIIREAEETYIPEHIEIGLQRDGLIISSLRGNLLEIAEKGEDYKYELEFKLSGFDKISGKMTVGRRSKRITPGRDVKQEIKPPLQKIAEDFSSLKKLRIY